MDENIIEQLERLLPALKALHGSVKEAATMGVHVGTGPMALKSYRGLYGRVADLLPDDFFITETLVLDIDDNADEQQIIARFDGDIDRFKTLKGLN